MTRVTTTILVVLVLMNGTVTTMAASGLSDDLGVELAPGVSQTMDDVIDRAKQGFSTDSGFGQTLFALFMSGVGLMEALLKGVYSAPTMMINLGFPSFVVYPLAAPLYLIGVLELMFVATGRDMI